MGGEDVDSGVEGSYCGETGLGALCRVSVFFWLGVGVGFDLLSGRHALMIRRIELPDRFP